jgi:CBS domain-containing protein
MRTDDLVSNACRAMWEQRAGSVLVVDDRQRLAGIFTGRDAVRLLAKGRDSHTTPLSHAMTRKPVAMTADCCAVEALRAMSDGGFRHVPVVENGKILGVVSRGDFKGMEFEEYRWRSLTQTRSEENRQVKDIVGERKSLVLASDKTVAEACRAMWKRKADCMLVTDRRHRLIGIFTGRDAVRVLARAKTPAMVRLARAMTPDPATTTPDSHAIDALRAMNDGGFRHLPVMSHGKIVGVVSRKDFTGSEIDRLDEETHLAECIW